MSWASSDAGLDCWSVDEDEFEEELDPVCWLLFHVVQESSGLDETELAGVRRELFSDELGVSSDEIRLSRLGGNEFALAAAVKLERLGGWKLVTRPAEEAPKPAVNRLGLSRNWRA